MVKETGKCGRNWEPPWTLGERLKFALVPATVYIRYKVAKERRYGEAEIALLPLLSDRRRVSLDIGANKGLYMWLLKDCSRAVHAFEPNPKMFRFLRRFAGGNISVSPFALSNRNGTTTLRVPRRRRGGYSSQGASLSKVKVADDYMGVEISARRLDDLSITDIGFIKIDVEGFEQAVLDGARKIIANDRPTMLIEMEEAHTKRPIEKAIAAVEALGYHGLFLWRGVLRPIEFFDGERHHRAAVCREDYVFNFIFLPKQ
jgi:FkbM family methyltransferase